MALSLEVVRFNDGNPGCCRLERGRLEFLDDDQPDVRYSGAIFQDKLGAATDLAKKFGPALLQAYPKDRLREIDIVLAKAAMDIVNADWLPNTDLVTFARYTCLLNPFLQAILPK